MNERPFGKLRANESINEEAKTKRPCFRASLDGQEPPPAAFPDGTCDLVRLTPEVCASDEERQHYAQHYLPCRLPRNYCERVQEDEHTSNRQDAISSQQQDQQSGPTRNRRDLPQHEGGDAQYGRSSLAAPEFEHWREVVPEGCQQRRPVYPHIGD